MGITIRNDVTRVGCLILLLGVALSSRAQENDAPTFDELRKAANQGFAVAQYNLGVRYDDGEGVPKDDAEAVKWYRKAAEQGDAGAQCNLGIMYQFGDGVPKDDVEAVKWYRKAADQGYAQAQYNLGVMYGKGEGVPKDDVEAYVWWNLAGQTLDDARENRDKIANDMTPEQIAEAQKRSKEFVPKPSSSTVANP